MTSDQLEKRLRERLPAPPPRPGFETRLRALAREPYEPGRKFLLARLALPATAVVVLVLVLIPKDQPSSPQAPVASAPDPGPSPIAALKEPVTREYEGLKKDAEWTLGLFRSALPSVPAMKEAGK